MVVQIGYYFLCLPTWTFSFLWLGEPSELSEVSDSWAMLLEAEMRHAWLLRYVMNLRGSFYSVFYFLQCHMQYYPSEMKCSIALLKFKSHQPF